RILTSRAGARAAVRAAGLTPWTKRNFARWLFEDYPRALVLTPSRWRKGAFTGPGAYRAA
ncbi:MAG: menaquinone-9 beta-reductase, partial [Actinomycetota bacterium]|nr:menaquinone-9 beta-reductase [Actinomycetota bacterium]